MLDTCPMKEDVAKNKWFQWTNKDIKHLHMTNYDEYYGNDDASVASESDVRVESARSVRSSAKSG